MDQARHLLLSHGLLLVQTRMEDVLQVRNPTDPFAGKPELGAKLRAALRSED